MIKRVKLQAIGTPAPTGFSSVKRYAPAPRDTTRPVFGSPIINASAGTVITGGVYRLPPKAKPHILQGWKSPN